jgi:hypothetical protein
MKYIADIQLAPSGGFKGFGKLGLEGDVASNATITFTNFLSTVIGVMTLVAIIWFIFQLISGAISYISSGGDKQAIESAGKRITNSLIGLIIVIISIFIIKLIGTLLGIPNILNFLYLFGLISGQ